MDKEQLFRFSEKLKNGIRPTSCLHFNAFIGGLVYLIVNNVNIMKVDISNWTQSIFVDEVGINMVLALAPAYRDKHHFY